MVVCIDEFQQIGEMPDTLTIQKTIRSVWQHHKQTSYQLNLIRAICAGYHTDLGKQEVTSQYSLGTRSNLPKLKKALIDRELAEETESGLYFSDPLFSIWFKRYLM